MADTFDLETGDFISSEIVVNKGPHPFRDPSAQRHRFVAEIVGVITGVWRQRVDGIGLGCGPNVC